MYLLLVIPPTRIIGRMIVIVLSVMSLRMAWEAVAGLATGTINHPAHNDPITAFQGQKFVEFPIATGGHGDV